MKVRDPRIVTPQSRGDKMAIEQIQREQALKANPLYGVVKTLEERVVHMSAQWRTANIRYQATMDYLAHVGILLHQDIGEDGKITGAPYSPNIPLFEKLVEMGIIESMPKYGFSAYFIEHNERTIFLIEMMTQLRDSVANMERILEMVREFNKVPDRLIPIAGVEFGLDGYLTANPDNWTEEKCDEVAREFGLVKGEEDGTENDIQPSTEEEQDNVVPFNSNIAKESNDPETTS